MDILLWLIQIILGIKLVTVSYTHGFRQSQATLQEAMIKMGRLAQPLLVLTAFCTFVGSAGLILPGILGLSARVTTITAGTLSVLLLISAFLHIKCREKPKIFVSFVLCVLAAFVAYGRWALVP